MSVEQLSAEQREKLCDAMRLTGQLQAAHQLVETINVPPDKRGLRDLVESANSLLRKAMLLAWESQS